MDSNTTHSDDAEKKSSSLIKMWMILTAIAVIGIILNLGVLLKRKFARRRCSSTTQSSLFLLATMAMADTLCLFSLLVLLVFRFLPVQHNPTLLTFVCKLDVFIMHTTSSFSIWCWLVLSAVRYMAVFRPYTHLKLNREPIIAVIAVAVFCCLSEMWVLWDMQYIEEAKACDGPGTELSRHFQISEMVISYFLPVALITILDLKVLLCRELWFGNHSHKTSGKTELTISCEGTEVNRKPSQIAQATSLTVKHGQNMIVASKLSRTRSKKRQQMRVLRRCLCITIFDLSMNLPSYLLRLYLAFTDNEDLNYDVVWIIEEISQVMYFAQFALNALYLFCIIYDTPRKKSMATASTLISSQTPRASMRKSNKSDMLALV